MPRSPPKFFLPIQTSSLPGRPSLSSDRHSSSSGSSSSPRLPTVVVPIPSISSPSSERDQPGFPTSTTGRRSVDTHGMADRSKKSSKESAASSSGTSPNSASPSGHRSPGGQTGPLAVAAAWEAVSLQTPKHRFSLDDSSSGGGRRSVSRSRSSSSSSSSRAPEMAMLNGHHVDAASSSSSLGTVGLGDRWRDYGYGTHGYAKRTRWSEYWKKLPRSIQWLCYAVGTLVLFSLVWSSPLPDRLRYAHLTQHTSTLASWPLIAATYAGPPACDPFARPGFLSFDAAHGSDASWVPFDPACPPAPDYLGGLRTIRDVPANETESEREKVIRRPRRQGWMLERFQGEGGEDRDDVDGWGRPYPDLTFLKGRLALLIGDSVDRNSLSHLADLVGARVRGFGYANVTAPMPEGWDGRNLPWLVNVGLVHQEWEGSWDGGGLMEGVDHPNPEGGEFAGLNAGFVNAFHYGMDDIDEFAAQGDWHPPGLAEDRITELFLPMMRQIGQIQYDPDYVHSPPHMQRIEPVEPSHTHPNDDEEGGSEEMERYRRGRSVQRHRHHRRDYRHDHDHDRDDGDDDEDDEFGFEEDELDLVLRADRAPAMISLHSGLWDLAFWGRRNRAANLPIDRPLSTDEMEWWQARMRHVVRTVKKRFPDTPIWMRLMHRVGEHFWASHDWATGLNHGMGEGFVNFFLDSRVHQIRDMERHVAKLEGLPIFDLGHVLEGFQQYQDKVHPMREPGGVVMGQAMMHHLWMESIGRKNWDEEARRGVGKLPHVVDDL